MNIRENIISTTDTFFSLGFNGIQEFTFYDIEQVRIHDRPLKTSSGTFFSQEIFLDSNIIYHSRLVYGILDLFGDVGGLLGILTTFIGYFVAPYNETSFLFKVAKREEEGFWSTMGIQMMKSNLIKKVMTKKMVKLKDIYDRSNERLINSLDIQTIMEENDDGESNQVSNRQQEVFT